MNAKCLLGGFIPEGNNAFYPPTVLTNVTKGMPAYDEELFGPVAAIISAKDEEDAIRIANDSVFGLGSAIFSKDIERAKKIAVTQIQAGSCFINALVKSDSRLPFGGISQFPPKTLSFRRKPEPPYLSSAIKTSLCIQTPPKKDPSLTLPPIK